MVIIKVSYKLRPIKRQETLYSFLLFLFYTKKVQVHIKIVNQSANSSKNTTYIIRQKKETHTGSKKNSFPPNPQTGRNRVSRGTDAFDVPNL